MATATAKDIENLAAIADGKKIHHASRARLVKLGLVRADGQLSGDAEFILAPLEDPEPAPAKARIRSTSPRPCGCGCGELTGGGDYRPGHDARHAGIVGRQVAADADGSTTSQQVRELVAAKLAGRPKLIDKAVGVATRELERSRMAAAKRSA